MYRHVVCSSVPSVPTQSKPPLLLAFNLHYRRSIIASPCILNLAGRESTLPGTKCFGLSGHENVSLYVLTPFSPLRIAVTDVSIKRTTWPPPAGHCLHLLQLDIFLFKRFYEDVRCKLNDLVKKDYSLALLESGTCTHRLRRFSNLA